MANHFTRARVALSLFARHLRIAGNDPSRWAWIVWRALRIIGKGRLSATLARHASDQQLYAGYPQWYAAHMSLSADDRARIAARIQSGGALPLLSVVMPTYNTPVAWLDEAVNSVRAQLYPKWELCIADDGSTDTATLQRLHALATGEPRIKLVMLERNGGIANASNAAIARAAGEFVVLLDHDDVLTPEALYLVWEAWRAFPDVQLLYSDEDKIGEDGALRDPHFKPCWDPDLAMTMNYLGHLVAIRRILLSRVNGFDQGVDGAQDWDLLLRCAERATTQQIRHIPRVLYHWRVHRNSTAAGLAAKPEAEDAQRTAISRAMERRGVSGDVDRTEFGWRVRRTMTRGQSVTVVIPTRSRVDLLRPLLERLSQDRREFDVDVVIVDHNSTTRAVALLADSLRPRIPVDVVAFGGPFNFAKLCNLGVANSRGEYVALLNDDVLPTNDEWMAELISQAARPDVGVAGGLLFYPDGRIQHAGILLGINGVAEHIWRGYPGSWGGIHGRARQVQETTAITGACAMMRRAVWQQVGGMDEMFARAFNDVDLCLRVRASGLKIIFTPFAEAIHLESATRGLDDAPALQQLYLEEERRFRGRWNDLGDVDSRYNPLLSSAGLPFSLSDLPAPAAPWRAIATYAAR